MFRISYYSEKKGKKCKKDFEDLLSASDFVKGKSLQTFKLSEVIVLAEIVPGMDWPQMVENILREHTRKLQPGLDIRGLPVNTEVHLVNDAPLEEIPSSKKKKASARSGKSTKKSSKKKEPQPQA